MFGLGDAMILFTRSASNLGLPSDLRTSRWVFGVASAFLSCEMLLTMYLGWPSIFLILTPLVGTVSSATLSVFISALFLVLNAIVLLGASYIVIVITYCDCSLAAYPIPRVEDLCDDRAEIGASKAG